MPRTTVRGARRTRKPGHRTLRIDGTASDQESTARQCTGWVATARGCARAVQLLRPNAYDSDPMSNFTPIPPHLQDMSVPDLVNRLGRGERSPTSHRLVRSYNKLAIKPAVAVVNRQGQWAGGRKIGRTCIGSWQQAQGIRMRQPHWHADCVFIGRARRVLRVLRVLRVRKNVRRVLRVL